MLIKESIYKVMLRLCTTKWKLFKWSRIYTTNLLKGTINSTLMLSRCVNNRPYRDIAKFLNNKKLAIIITDNFT